MQLYEFPPTRSIRARWTLQELGVPFEPVLVDLRKGAHRRPEFLKWNSAGKVPVLVDGDVVVAESVAIALYLAEKYADRGLWPEGLAARAQLHRWLLFAATELEQPLWRMARHTFLYPEEKRSKADYRLAAEDYLPMGAVFEEHLCDREFAVGERFSIADVVLAHTLDWADTEQLLERFPRSRDYLERMYARPAAPPRIAAAFASLPSLATA